MKSGPTTFIRPFNLHRRFAGESLVHWRFASGRPSRLAGLIAGLTLAALTAGAVDVPLSLQLRGEPGKTYTIEASTDLQHWTAVKTAQADATGRVGFSDSQAGNFSQRFYRARPDAVSLLGAPYRRDRVLVKPKAGITLADLSALNATLGATRLNTFPRMGNLQVIRTPANLTASTLVQRYRQSGLVQYAEHDHLVHAQVQPNDTHFQDGSLWNLHNTGQDGGVNDADLDAPEAWDTITSAANVIVAVTDTGVRYTHEDLAPNMWVNPGEIAGNGLDDDNNGFVDDVHGMNTLNNSGDPNEPNSTSLFGGHGTHVAGTIGAMGNNGVGVAGICWRVKIMALKFIDPDGNGSVSDAIRCIDYARSKGAHVINASWGATTFTSQALQDAIASARDAGIIFSAAAGNSGTDNDVNPLYPASYGLDNIIAAAATTRTDGLSDFSNFGATTVDLGAPGSAIGSCWNGSDSDYQYSDGSSMAAAHVSGVAALVRARYPNEDYRQIINRILAGVDPLPGLAGKCTTGGRLNAQRALGTTPPTPPVVTVSATDSAATEAGDPGTFTVTRTGSTATALTVNYTLGGTASNGTDYQSLSGTVTVPAGSISTTITVTPIADTANEGAETVVLTLAANSSYTVGSPGSATVTIAEGGSPTEEPVVTLSEFDPNASETGPDQGIIRFHRTGDPSQPIHVSWTFSGTAVNGSDFEELPTSSDFPLGQSEAPLTIMPIDDSAVEGSETVVVTLVDGPGYTVGSPNSMTITLTDNDDPQPTPPTVTVTASDDNSSEAGDPGEFTVSRTGSTASPLTVNYSMNGSAGNGSDYQNLAGSVTIASGASSATITLTPINDTAVEGNETAVLTLAANSAYTIGSPSGATVIIADDDQPPALPTVTVAASDASAAEPSNTGTFTVSRTGSTAASLTVNYTMNGSAENGTDYQNLSGSVSIAAGAISANITLTPINDTEVEGNETAVLTLLASSAYTVGSPNSATVTIADNDQPPAEPVFTLSVPDPDASESGSGIGVIRIHRTGDTSQAIQINWTFSGSAVNGSDFEQLSTTGFFAAGETEGDLTITPIDDSQVEGIETVTVTLVDGPGYSVSSPSSATVTIADNDQPSPLPTVTVTASDANAAEPSNTGTFTVSRTGSTAASLTVNYTMNGSARNGTDYQNLSGSVTIAAGSSSASITVTPIDDSAVEGNESVSLTLSASSAYTVGSPSSATVTIADNDQPPPLPTVTVTASDANAAEPSNTGTFTVSRTGSTASSLTVNYSLNGSAQNGTDYQNLSGSVTIAAGSSSATITLTPIDDTAAEGNETAVLTLSSSSAYTVGSPNSATVTIADNDQPPPPFVADFTATPLLGLVPLVVDFTDRSTGNPVSWHWSFGDGGTSTARHPTHIYLVPGDYTATLTVRNSVGNTSSKSVVIRATLLSLPLTSAAETPE